MFGKNRVMVPKDYASEPPNTLKVTSIFYTVQGEGPFAGTPCCFIRLMGCNLLCSFCDTFFDAGDRLTYEQTIRKVIDARAQFFLSRGRSCPPLPHYFLLVITGGEPLNQPNLTAFLAWCHAWDFTTQIESNGTIDRLLPGATTLVVSPKINERTGKYVKPVMLERADALKFVISKRMEGYQDVPEFALAWRDAKRGRKIYVSPMNRYIKEPIKLGPDGTLEGRSETDERISFWTPGLLDMEQNQENHEYAAELALRYGVTLTLQAHLYASLP